MSSPQTDNSTANGHAQPIPIDTSKSTPQRRRRSSSVWSNPGLSPSDSPLSTAMSTLTTPSSFTTNFPRQQGTSPTNSNSPLAYFLAASSPVKSTGFTWPAGGRTSPTSPISLSRQFSREQRGSESAIAEDSDLGPGVSQGGRHFRSGSVNGWGTAGRDRAAGVMRRLSLSGALGAAARPSIPVPPNVNVPQQQQLPPSPPAPQQLSRSNTIVPASSVTPTRPFRSARRKDDSLGVPGQPKKRSVSPMGERMLKGHFDGFGL